MGNQMLNLAPYIPVDCLFSTENQGPCVPCEGNKRRNYVSWPFSCCWYWNGVHLLQHVPHVHRTTEKEGEIKKFTPWNFR